MGDAARGADRAHDLIEGVIYLPENLFYNTSAPGILLFLNKSKPKDRRGKLFLVNASQVVEKGDPKNFIPAAGIERIAMAFLAWQEEEKFTRVVTREHVAKEDYNISPSRYIQVADADGNLFSATPSSGWILGGAFVAGKTGVPMSNRMQAFHLDPASPNVLAGGKRPRTTLTPSILLKDGKPFLAIGTPGGDRLSIDVVAIRLMYPSSFPRSDFIAR